MMCSLHLCLCSLDNCSLGNYSQNCTDTKVLTNQRDASAIYVSCRHSFFREMNSSRARFKLAIRYIKRHENQMRQEAIANALCEDGEGNFWKEIKKLTPNNVPLPTSIGDANGKKEVTELWKTHFEQLLNCVSGRDTKNLSYECMFNLNMGISPREIKDAISS